MKRMDRMPAGWRMIFLCLAAALLAACSATGPLFSGWEKPPEGKAALYVYRTVNFQPDMVYTVKVDGVAVGGVHHDGYLAVPVMPGDRVVQVYEASYLAPATAPLSIKFEAGKIYPIQYDTSEVRFNFSGYNNAPLMYGRRKIVLRGMEQALPVLQPLHRSTN